jgi:hypothetical protein
MKQLLKAISTDYTDAIVGLNRAPRRRPWSCQMHCWIAADNQFSGRPPAVWAHPQLHSEWLHTGNCLPRQALLFPHDDFLRTISAAWLQVSSWPTWTERSDVGSWHNVRAQLGPFEGTETAALPTLGIKGRFTVYGAGLEPMSALANSTFD